MAGRPSQRNPSISQLTLPPETIPSCYPENATNRIPTAFRTAPRNMPISSKSTPKKFGFHGKASTVRNPRSPSTVSFCVVRGRLIHSPIPKNSRLNPTRNPSVDFGTIEAAPMRPPAAARRVHQCLKLKSFRSGIVQLQVELVYHKPAFCSIHKSKHEGGFPLKHEVSA
jgi:hypothetical protein